MIKYVDIALSYLVSFYGVDKTPYSDTKSNILKSDKKQGIYSK